MLDFSEAKQLLKKTREEVLSKERNPFEWASLTALSSAIDDLDKRLNLIESNQNVIIQMLRKIT